MGQRTRLHGNKAYIDVRSALSDPGVSALAVTALEVGKQDESGNALHASSNVT